jgi:N-acetylmuramic acid 6-phosphate etherase
MASRVRYDRLSTERAHPSSPALDRLAPLAIVRLMSQEDARAVEAVRRVLPAVARGVDVIVEALRAGGRLFLVGAGTSGRLGVLEAAECPPTFGTPPRQVQAIMAGGRSAVFRSREGAEDDRAAAARVVRARVRAGDVVVGISASGVTPFVDGALGEARRRGAATLLVTCNPGPACPRPRARPATGDAARRGTTTIIAPAPGPEVLAGSTRLKAGTATKLILNMLTTASMARLGRVHGNRMIDLQPRSAKLRARAARLVEEIAGVSAARARRALAGAGGQVRVAVVIARTGLPAAASRRALRRAGGSLSAVLATATSLSRGAGRPGGPRPRGSARRSS